MKLLNKLLALTLLLCVGAALALDEAALERVSPYRNSAEILSASALAPPMPHKPPRQGGRYRVNKLPKPTSSRKA